MFEQIDTLWVLTVFVTGWVGYRLAEHDRLPPLAGFALGVAVNTVLVADIGVFERQISGSSHLQMLSVCFSLLLLMSLFVLAGRRKALQVLKLAAVVSLISATFSLVPRQTAAPGGAQEHFSFSIPDGQVSYSVPRSILPARLLEALDGSRLGFTTLARVNGATPLYYGVRSRPTVARAQVRQGSWVLVRGTVSGPEGRDWVQVLVPDGEGNFNEKDGPVGYVPADTLSFHVPIPAMAD